MENRWQQAIDRLRNTTNLESFMLLVTENDRKNFRLIGEGTDDIIGEMIFVLWKKLQESPNKSLVKLLKEKINEKNT